MLSFPGVMHQRRPSLLERWTRGLRRWGLARRARQGRGISARGIAAGLLAAAALALPREALAHEIPERVAIMGYVRPDGLRVELLLRVPLEAMRDLDFPLMADGSLDLVRVRALLPQAAKQWITDYLALEAGGRTLADPRILGTRIALPNDRSFEDWANARAHFDLPALESVPGLQWQAALFDVRLEYTLEQADAPLVLRPALAHLGIRTTSVLHVIAADGTDRILVYEGNPDRIALEPRWHDAARQFVGEGFRHILGGIDHLLFVLCLVLPVRRWRSLVAIVTAFTLAHSLTLGAAALGLAPAAGWFPPLVETLIAASIVWLTLENIVLPAERLENRWALAFGFGLVHGFGFSFALGDTLQFAGGHLVMALASFNVGVELGQLLVLALALPALQWVHRHVGADRERLVTIVGSALVAHTAWHWMSDRWATLGAFRGQLAWPALDATLALGAMRAALLLTLALALGLALRHILRTVWKP